MANVQGGAAPGKQKQRQAYLDSYGKNIEPNRRRSSVMAFEVA